MRRFFLVVYIFLLTASCVVAQRKISGIITHENIPIIGIRILVKETGTTTLTDIKGEFSIEIPNKNTVLLISHPEFNSLEVIVDRQVSLNIALERKFAIIEPVEMKMVLDSMAFVGSSPPLISKIEPDKNYAIVRVFFATDRNLTESTIPNERFGSFRDKVRYGICDVSIPRDHQIGELEEPSVWRFEFKDDPEKHVALLTIDVKSKSDFFISLKDRVNDSPEKKSFLFVHGYNVSFEDASRRTAQMSYDLGFDGAPVFYSWPSQATLLGYNIDEGNVSWSQSLLKDFLLEFLKNSESQNIYLIAHSMGNRGLTGALASIVSETPQLTNRIKEIILAAPDIDADVFKRDIAPALIKCKKPITLYTSNNDLALKASFQFSSYPRAGQAGQSIIVLPGIETIDASNVKTDFLGHSYFGDSSAILSDIFSIIYFGKRPNERENLVPVNKNGEFFWRLN